MRRYILLLFICFTQIFFTDATAIAQDRDSSSNSISGFAVYSARISAHIRINQPSFSVDTLFFTRKNSLYQWQYPNNNNSEIKEIKKKYSDAKITLSPLRSDKIGRVNFYDVTNDSLLTRRIMLGLEQIYLIKEKAPDIPWNITDSTKKLGNYRAIKATAHFRGRDYTAWFTPEIPVPYGPWKLLGLPGLILQAYDKQNDIWFKAKKIVFKDIESIESIPLNGKEKVINLAEYKKLISELDKLQVQQSHKSAREHFRNNNVEVMFEFTEANPMELFGENKE